MLDGCKGAPQAKHSKKASNKATRQPSKKATKHSNTLNIPLSTFGYFDKVEISSVE